MSERVLLTGASGFVGGEVRLKLIEVERLVRIVSRNKLLPYSKDVFFLGAIDSKTNWELALSDISIVIHCAARVHVMNESSTDPLQAFREVNVAGALNLAKQAAAAGVKRFIFISSIKVNGEGTAINCKFTSSDQAAQEEPYGISKHEAEQGLIKLSKETGMELVIIRPTLVYGPGVKGNFLNLLKLSKLPIPLPFGLINNKRSMVYLDNLVDLIITCIDHPKAVNRIFLASDGDDLSLARLLTLIRRAMSKPPLLLPISMGLFKLLGRLSGKTAVVDRLIGDLQVDSSDTKTLLGWQPPYTVEQGIKATVDAFMQTAPVKK
jgi:UDP-glucose 4-epimerase